MNESAIMRSSPRTCPKLLSNNPRGSENSGSVMGRLGEDGCPLQAFRLILSKDFECDHIEDHVTLERIIWPPTGVPKIRYPSRGIREELVARGIDGSVETPHGVHVEEWEESLEELNGFWFFIEDRLLSSDHGRLSFDFLEFLLQMVPPPNILSTLRTACSPTSEATLRILCLRIAVACSGDAPASTRFPKRIFK